MRIKLMEVHEIFRFLLNNNISMVNSTIRSKIDKIWKLSPIGYLVDWVPLWARLIETIQ